MTTDTQRAAFEALLDDFAVAEGRLQSVSDRGELIEHCGKRRNEKRSAVLAAFDAARGTAEQVRRDAAHRHAQAINRAHSNGWNDALEQAAIEAAGHGIPGHAVAGPHFTDAIARAIRALSAPETPRTTDEADCAPYLKDGETPRERIERERADTDACMTLLVQEKRRAQRLRVGLQAMLGEVAGLPGVDSEVVRQAAAMLVDTPRTMAAQPASPAPSPRIEAQPVGYVPNRSDELLREQGGSVELHARQCGAFQVPVYLAPPDSTPDARSTSDAAVVRDVDELAQLIRIVDGKRVLGAGALAVRICDWLADRATRSTDSRAEAA